MVTNEYWYKIYGCTLCSDVEYPQLITTDCRKADIFLRLTPMQRKSELPNGCYIDPISKEHIYFCNQTGCFQITSGNTIEIWPNEDRRIEELTPFVFGYCIAMLFWQRGCMAIHCSSSEYQGKAVIVAGNSGAGKSTLTTCLIDHGFRLLTDDVAILKEENQNFRVSPAFPQQKLCRDAVKRNHLEIQDLLYIDEEKDKFALDRKAQFCEEETPLAAMIFLAVHDSDKAVHCRELKGHEKLIHLMQNMFLFPMFRESNAFSPMEMARCLRVAQNVPIYEISRPAGIDSTEAQYRVIMGQCFADKEIV